MLIYLGVLAFDLLILILSRFLPKSRKIELVEMIIFILPLIGISAFKGMNVGLDTSQYYNIYNLSVVKPLFDSSLAEVGYTLICRVFKLLNVPFFVFLLVMYTLIYGAVLFFCFKKSKNSLYLLFFIMYFGFFGFSISGIRQSFAIALMLLGFSFYEYKKPVSMIAPIIAVLIALTIHRTTFFVLPLIFILLFNYKPQTFVIITLIALIIGIVSPFIYSMVVIEIKSYLLPSKNASFWTLIIYILFGVLTALLINEKSSKIIFKFFKSDKGSNFFNKASFELSDDNTEYAFSYKTATACIVYPAFILLIGNYSPVFSRINYYLLPFTGLYLITLINRKQIPTKLRFLLNSLFILFVSGYFVYSVLLKNPLSVVPFQFGPIA